MLVLSLEMGLTSYIILFRCGVPISFLCGETT
jgi:hypothetical protein